MATWPATLPAPLINTFQESAADNIIRTTMDKGPAKVRRRTTANSKAIKYALFLTPAQVETLLTFYNTTTFSGADEFTYTHPRSGDTVSARFTEPPSIGDVNGLNYRADISLEILP